MTDSVFLSFWEDICSHFGYKSASNVRIICLYKNTAADIPDTKRMELADAVLTDCDRFPGLGKFKDICDRFLPRSPSSKYRNAEKCLYCDDNGFIYTDRTYAWSCPKCNMGKKFKNQNYPPYDEKFGKEALEELAKQKMSGEKVPLEVLKARFFESISKWNCRL